MKSRFLSLLGKVTALAMLGLALFAVYLIVAAPVVGRLSGLRERIEEQRSLLGRYLAAAGMEKEADRIDLQSKSAAGSRVFLPGNSDAVRLAQLQSLASRVAQAEGVTVRSARSLQPRERDGVKFLGIEAQLSCTIEQLQRIVHTLESDQPYLFIDTLQVTPPRAAPEQDPMAAARLDVRIGVLGAVPLRKG